MYANVRRAAVEGMRRNRANVASPTQGAAERRALVPTLSALNRKMLDALATDDALKSEADEYLVYECVPVQPGDRAPVETDMAPRLVIKRVVGLSQMKPVASGLFYVPVYAVHDVPAWTDSRPQFSNWLLSSVRFPVFDEMQRMLTRSAGEGEQTIRVPSFLDRLDVYFGALTGTLGEYFRSGKWSDAHNTWRLMRSLTSVVDVLRPDDASFKGVPAQLDVFQERITNRDRSRAEADAYRDFLAKLKPAHYYWLLYNTMVTNPELVHKSRFANMDGFLLGLMTQAALPDHQGCTYAGIEEHLLRMILERAMKHVTTRDLKTYVEDDALVAYLHSSAGKPVESALRYWTFMAETLRTLLLVRPFAKTEFIARLAAVRDSVLGMQGITPFCLALAPSAGRYLNDAVIAEFILAAGEAESRFTVLLTNIFSAHAQDTPGLHGVLSTNAHRVEAMRRRVQEVTSSSAPAADGVWQAFLAKNDEHAHYSGVSLHYKQAVVAYARDGSAVSLACIQALHSGDAGLISARPMLMGGKRLRALCLRAAPRASAVFDHFAAALPPGNLDCLLAQRPRGAMGVLLHDATSTVDTAVLNKAKDAADTTPIAFVKFEVARALVRERIAALNATLDAVPAECYICFEEGPSVRMVPLHGDPRHAVCAGCRPKLKDACPFCREKI